MTPFVESIDPFDDYGFQVKSKTPWRPETPEKEIERLTWNKLKYEQFLLNGSTFPRKVYEARRVDFYRLENLLGGWRGR